MTTQAILERIKELTETEPALVGADEGTHSHPDAHRIYETVLGERFATYSFGGSIATKCSESEARKDTHGRIIDFPNETARIRALADELRTLKRKL